MAKSKDLAEPARVIKKDDFVVLVSQISEPQLVSIVREPYWQNYAGDREDGAWWIDVLGTKGRDIEQLSLGDIGVKGYAYDNRPDGLVYDLKDVARIDALYKEWYTLKRNTLRSLNVDFDS